MKYNPEIKGILQSVCGKIIARVIGKLWKAVILSKNGKKRSADEDLARLSLGYDLCFPELLFEEGPKWSILGTRRTYRPINRFAIIKSRPIVS